MEGGGERKRKSPLELGWDKLLRQDDDEDPVLLAKPAEEKSMTDGGEEPSRDDHFRQTSDEELVIEIVRMKRTYPSLAANLPDRAEKFLASIKRHEEELERRKHQKANGRCKKPTQSTDPTFVEIMAFDPSRLNNFLKGKAGASGQPPVKKGKKRTREVSGPGEDSRTLLRDDVSEKVPPPPPRVSPAKVIPEVVELEDDTSKDASQSPDIIERYRKELTPSMGLRHLEVVLNRALGIAQGIAFRAADEGEQAEGLSNSVTIREMKIEQLGVENKDLKQETDMLEKELGDAMDRAEELKLEFERTQKNYEEKLLAAEATRALAVEEFKNSEEFGLLQGEYASGSHNYAFKQARALLRKKAVETEDIRDDPELTEGLALSETEESPEDGDEGGSGDDLEIVDKNPPS